MADEHADQAAAEEPSNPVHELRLEFDAQFDRVRRRFDEMTANLVRLGEHMDRRFDTMLRRFDAMERRQATDMAFIKQVLADHEGRIRGLEDAPSRPS